ncbi:hypothetical protein AD998_07535 [bacterium 336/3]|nr:hypothetical protein AD998_07535 [bacterium 336/3]
MKELVKNSSRSCFQIDKKWYAFTPGLTSFLYGGEAETPAPIEVKEALKRSDVLKYLVENKSGLVEEITEETLINELTESQILSEENEALKEKYAKLEAELEALKAGKQ